MAAAQQLMKKGKLELAAYIKSECTDRAGHGGSHLGVLLDYLLDPTKGIDDDDRLDWCRALLAGGVNFETFAKTGELSFFIYRINRFCA